MTAAIEASGLTRRFGSTRAVDGARPRRRRRRRRPARPQRFGQDDAAAHAGHGPRRRRTGRLRLLGFDPAPGVGAHRDPPPTRLPPAGRRPLPGIHRVRTRRLRRRAEGDDRWRAPRVTRCGGCSQRSTSPTSCTRRSGPCREGCASASRSPSAMLGSPRLLVLDEPAAGLDPEQRLRLRSILSDAGRDGTVVLSTHHTDEVAALCHRVVVLLGGRVRFVGITGGTGRHRRRAGVARRRRVDTDRHRNRQRMGDRRRQHPRHRRSPPSGVELVEPTIDDGYLLLTHQAATR